MKKVILTLFCGILLFSACSKSEMPDENKIIKTAWEYIPDDVKETITHPWNEGRIDKAKENYKFNNVSCWLVVFNTTDDELLGPLCVYVDKKREKAIGIGERY